MRILTYTEAFVIDSYENITFDYSTAMVAFGKEGQTRRLYFDSISSARKFIEEIITALYERCEVIDLGHYKFVTDYYNIGYLLEMINCRIENKNTCEDE